MALPFGEVTRAREISEPPAEQADETNSPVLSAISPDFPVARSTQPGLPLRSEVEAQLAEAWDGEACWQRRVALDLHYLDNRIDISLYIAEAPADMALDALADKLKKAGTKFVIEPHIRFKGQVGEQATMFFLDPCGNALEFKAFKDMGSLFAK